MESEDKILASALRRLGGIGAQWVARFLPMNVSERSLELPLPIAAATDVVNKRLEGATLLPDEAKPEVIRAIVGSGRLNLNPALLTIRLTPLGGAVTRLSIRGVAKEGLIKQRAGEQAVSRFVDSLITGK